MRLIGGASLIVILATVLAVSGIRSSAQTSAVTVTDAVNAQANSNAGRHEEKRFSATTRLATSNSGPACCACTRSSLMSIRKRLSPSG